MSAHTPGPWRHCRGSNPDGCICGLVWSIPEDSPVAEAFGESDEAGVRHPPEVRAANARLMAAAPELLEACRTALALMEGMEEFHDGAEGTDARRAIEAAIAKAEGRE